MNSNSDPSFQSEQLSVAELVAKHAAAMPDSVAVRGGAATLTYGELNAGANQLAHHLRTLRIGPDQVVGPTGCDPLIDPWLPDVLADGHE